MVCTYRAYQERYHDYELVLTADSKLAKGGEVALIQLSLPDQTIKDLGISLQGKGIKSVLHPDVLASVKDPNERESLKNFLTGFTGIQIKDIKTICQEALLLRILTSSPRPSVEELLKYTIHCQQILGEDVGHNIEFWVLTKQGEIRSARGGLTP